MCTIRKVASHQHQQPSDIFYGQSTKLALFGDNVSIPAIWGWKQDGKLWKPVWTTLQYAQHVCYELIWYGWKQSCRRCCKVPRRICNALPFVSVVETVVMTSRSSINSSLVMLSTNHQSMKGLMCTFRASCYSICLSWVLVLIQVRPFIQHKKKLGFGFGGE